MKFVLVALICFNAAITGVESQCNTLPTGGLNTDVATTCASVADGAVCTATCDSGFTTSTGQTTVTVACSSGSYATPLGDCDTPILCTAPTTYPTGVELLYNGGLMEGDVQVYGCMDGFEHTPPTQEVTCSNGMYPSGQPQECTLSAVECGPIPTVPGVMVTPTSTMFTGSGVTVACDVGWELVSALVNEIMCTMEGEWDPPIWSFCQQQTCSPPSTLPAGVMLTADGGTNEGDVQVYQCMIGFYNAMIVQAVTCTGGSYPVGQPEACTPIDCLSPPTTPGVTASPSTTLYTGNPVTVTCDRGWELIDPSENEMMCTLSGEWYPPIWSFCQIQPCTLPSAVPEGVVLVSVGLTQGDYIEIYDCLPGYERSPSTQVITCGAGQVPGNTLEACTLIGAAAAGDTANTDAAAGTSDTTNVSTDPSTTSDRKFGVGEMIGTFCGGVGLVITAVLGISYLKQRYNQPAYGAPYGMGNGTMQPNHPFTGQNLQANRVWQQRMLMNQMRNQQIRNHPI